MGYETNFTIEVVSGTFEDDLANELTKHTKYTWEFWGGVKTAELDGKWYNWEEEMLSFSIKFPDALFKLCGDGEVSGDIWYCVFKNGKSSGQQSVILKYPKIEFEGHIFNGV